MGGKLILTAQGFYSDTVKNKFIELTGEKSNKSVAFIVTAAKDKENNKFNIRDRETLLSMGFQSVDFIDLEANPNIELSKYSVIYVCGGNSFKLLKYAKEANLKDKINILLSKGGIYLGISSGSLILGPSVILANEVTPDNNEASVTDLTGLEVIPYTIYPHYSPEIENDLVKFETKHGITVYRLTNEQAIILDMNPMTPELI